jgi:hypothetical protein
MSNDDLWRGATKPYIPYYPESYDQMQREKFEGERKIWRGLVKQASLHGLLIGAAIGAILGTWGTLIVTTIMLNQQAGCGP